MKTMLFCNTWEPGRHKEPPAPADIDYPHYWIDENYCGLGAPLIEMAASLGYRIESLTYCEPENADILCFWECPRGLCDSAFEHGLRSGKEMYLFATEHDGIVKENIDPINALFFKKIFTYYPRLIDGVKYIGAFPMFFQVPEAIDRTPFEERKFSAMIGHIPHGGALNYHERASTALWFSANHPDQLDMYAKQTGYSGSMNEIKCYRGPCGNKRKTLAGFKFCFCYENSADYPGYVTEKIFDSIFAGCIPVYLGPPDRSAYIPDGCYIDRARFKDNQELYDYMVSIDGDAFNKYQDALSEFVNSDFCRRHSPLGFAELVIKNIIR